MYRKTCDDVKTKEFKDNKLPPPSQYGILMSTTAAKHLQKCFMMNPNVGTDVLLPHSCFVGISQNVYCQ